MTWYENGVQESEQKYKEGKPHGLHKDWHENGQKAETSNYKEGKRHGFHAEWYDNGEKFIEKNCKNVGKDFPREARNIHYDKKSLQGIYGQATPEETSELLDEGIEVATIPWIDKTEN